LVSLALARGCRADRRRCGGDHATGRHFKGNGRGALPGFWRHHLVAVGRCREAVRFNKVGWKQWNWWLHHLSFIRVPLVRPDKLLRKLLPWVRPLCSAPGLLMIALASLMGILL
jgi:hypothetical protein